MKLLVDTSIWVDYLRGADARLGDALDGYLDQESVLMCGPVIAEVLAGTAPEQREETWLALGNLPWAELDQLAWRQIGEAAYELRRRGISLPLTDVVISVAALNAEADVWTRDADFARIREALPDLRLL